MTPAPASGTGRLPRSELVHLAALFNAGRHAEMQAAAEKATRRCPGDGIAWKALGTALQVQGKDGLEALRRAVQLLPADAEARANLGSLLMGRGELDAAVSVLQAALAIDPRLAPAHCNLGDALAQQGDAVAAEAACRAALRLQPGLAAAHCNLGRALALQGRAVDAEQACRRALDLQPTLAPAHHGLGLALRAQGRRGEAAQSLTEALRLQPALRDARLQLCSLWLDLDRPGQAEVVCREGLDRDPLQPELLANLGAALLAQGRAGEAADACRRSLAIKPAQVPVLANLGSACLALDQVSDALAALRAAVEVEPGQAWLRASLAHALLVAGRPERARDQLQSATVLEPAQPRWLSEWLFVSRYLDRDEADARRTLEGARRYGRLVRRADQPPPRPDDDREARPLRLGLVSGDLRDHPVGRFLEPVLASWQAQRRFELWSYATQPRVDGLTQRLRSRCDGWRDVSPLDDDALVHQLRADRLDIVIDLSGHTRHHRLAALAGRVAPLQVSWLGSCSTTGLAEMDGVVVDEGAAPAGIESQFVEPLLRLSSPVLCFVPPDHEVELGTPSPGPLRLACFNRLAKMGDEVVAAWSDILRRLPGSTLSLQDRALVDPGVCRQVRSRFEAQGVDAERLQLRPAQPWLDYLAAYRDADLALDPFPYPGGTTTLEALWMGVPVLTLAGATPLARQGAALLRRLALDDWVADSVDGYVERAVRHGQQRAVAALDRSSLRQRLLSSELCSGARVAAALEQSLLSAWRIRRSSGLPSP